jgi:hypothetical protein
LGWKWREAAAWRSWWWLMKLEVLVCHEQWRKIYMVVLCFGVLKEREGWFFLFSPKRRLVFRLYFFLSLFRCTFFIFYFKNGFKNI